MADDIIHDPFPDGGSQPEYFASTYGRTAKVAPDAVQKLAPRTATELSGPVFDAGPESDRNLAEGKNGFAIGQLMRLKLRVLDEDGRPQAGSMIELWQANAAGKYQHPQDGRDAPLDPNFRSWGRGVVGADGEIDFLTIRPGAYPVPNTGGWWRPPHIHISAYGASFLSRLVTQVYFPGDPLNAEDGILQSIPDVQARERLMLQPDDSVGIHETALGYRFDLVLRGRAQTPVEG